jgi:glucokinase
MMLLAGDIGGTKTVLAVCSTEAGAHAPLVEATFPSSRYGRLEAIVHEFLANVNMQVDRACFGVAGPVVAGTAQVTNLPWLMSEASLMESFGWQAARLLNDLEAIAYAIPILEPDDIRTLNAGAVVQRGNIAVIAPGTGLGEAFLTWDSDHYRAHASEGGHASFAPSSELELGLLSYMRRQLGHGHVSFERVCSGLGIPNIYYYLKQVGYAEEPAWLGAALADATDPTPVIMDSAAGKTQICELTAATLATFISILGAESGNLALKVLSTAGVYLGGGIPPRILAALEEPAFLEAFRHKGRFRDLLTEMPVHVILNPKTALLGAASYGLTM